MCSDLEVLYGFIQLDFLVLLSDECGWLIYVFNELLLMFGEVRFWSVIYYSCGFILYVYGVFFSSEVEVV